MRGQTPPQEMSAFAITKMYGQLSASGMHEDQEFREEATQALLPQKIGSNETRSSINACNCLRPCPHPCVGGQSAFRDSARQVPHAEPRSRMPNHLRVSAAPREIQRCGRNEKGIDVRADPLLR